jgi:hypothetical protein
MTAKIGGSGTPKSLWKNIAAAAANHDDQNTDNGSGAANDQVLGNAARLPPDKRFHATHSRRITAK